MTDGNSILAQRGRQETSTVDDSAHRLRFHLRHLSAIGPVVALAALVTDALSVGVAIVALAAAYLTLYLAVLGGDSDGGN